VHAWRGGRFIQADVEMDEDDDQ